MSCTKYGRSATGRTATIPAARSMTTKVLGPLGPPGVVEPHLLGYRRLDAVELQHLAGRAVWLGRSSGLPAIIILPALDPFRNRIQEEHLSDAILRHCRPAKGRARRGRANEPQSISEVLSRRQMVLLATENRPHAPSPSPLPAYAATKGAIDTLVKHFASMLGARGIRANAVAPGVVDTEMSNFTKTGVGASRWVCRR
jgi:NAD(P)-dependent dehydrogenase (short-subunit alcohol dehydrogenase family)